jgi:hypothetical protein
VNIAAGTNGSYAVNTGEPIFLEGQNANSINILAKGKVDVYISPNDELQNIDSKQLIAKSYKLFSIDKNIFIGANDLFLSKKHTFSYRASEDSIIFCYFIDNINGIEKLFKEKNEYSTYIMNSISNITEHSYNSLKELEQLIKSLSVMADNLCLFFWILKDKHGFSYEPTHAAFRDSIFKLEEMKEEKTFLPYSFDVEFLESNHFEYDYFPSEEIDTLKMNYYTHLSTINADLKKQFLNDNFIISQYNCTDSSLLLESILLKIKEAFKVTEEYIELLYSEQKPCIYEEFFKAGLQMGDSLYDPMDIIEVQQYMLDKIKSVVDIFRNDYNHVLTIDINAAQMKLDNLVAALNNKTPNTSLSNDSYTAREGIPEELNNSAEKILEYSNIPKERYDLFMNSLKAFRGLKDKLSDDEQVRKIRKDITALFFEVYEAVLKRVTIENNQDKLLHMFLTYSYMDEKLLSPKNLWTLYDLSENSMRTGQDSVFSMKNWLQLIYNKEKDPSVNGFSQDYFDNFREMRKQGTIKESDKAAYDNNKEGRLHFEVDNMFKINHKLSNRHISTYFPILYDEVIVKDLDKALVTTQKVNEAIQKVLDVDFSAFHRQISYFNMKKRIEKEFIMQAVKPDIILMPVYGNNPIMWQDISGRVRNTPGRFILPIFTEGNIDDMVQRLIGNLRWELCKTMMGLSWNDISIKSLTSEYMDYLQFYKKNKDISEEGKEKIKNQIKKYRSISKDVFISDYIIWLNYESNGTIRLNKFTREILYKFCPFSKEIRQKLITHPSFTQLENRYENHRAKQAKDLENRYSKYTREGIALDQEMIDTLEFYKNS